MELQVSSLVEERIAKSVDKLLGNADTNLNTIVKMTMLNYSPETKKKICEQIKQHSIMQAYLIDKEFQLTIDKDGNIADIYNPDGEEESKENS